MDAVDASLAKGERGAEEAGRALGTLGALLAAFPGDMDPVFQVGGIESGGARHSREPSCLSLGDRSGRGCTQRQAGKRMDQVCAWAGDGTSKTACAPPPPCLAPPCLQDDMLSFFTDTAGTLRGIGEEAPRCRDEGGGICVDRFPVVGKRETLKWKMDDGQEGGGGRARQHGRGQARQRRRCCTPRSPSLPTRFAPARLNMPCSTATRLMGPLLSATNTYLLANGRDVAAALPALHAALYTPVLRGGARDPRLRDAAVAYLRLQLQLGTLAKEQGKLQVGGWGGAGGVGRVRMAAQCCGVCQVAAVRGGGSGGARCQVGCA